MIRKSGYPLVVSLIGLIAALGIAWGFDALIQYLNNRNQVTVSLSLLITWCLALFALLLAAIWLLLAWFVLSQAPRNIWISLVFLIVGLFIVTYPALVFTPLFCCWVPYIGPLQISRTMYLFSSGGFIAIIGLLNLVLPSPRTANIFQDRATPKRGSPIEPGGMAKAKTGKILFGLLLGFVGGSCFGLVSRLVVQNILRTGYNSYYAESGSGLPAWGMFFIGWVTGILVPMVNRRLLRPLVGAGVWMLGEVVFLSLPFVYSTLLNPSLVMVACGVISLIAGGVLGGFAAWVDFS